MSGQNEAHQNENAADSDAFADLRLETRVALESLGRRVRYRAGQIIAHENEAGNVVGRVVSGVLRVQKTLADGRRPIVGLLVEGDLFGQVFDGDTEMAIEAATDAEIIAYPCDEFERLLKRAPDLDQAVLANILDELERARDWMVILSNQKVVSRVAGFLLAMCTRFAAIDHLLAIKPGGIQVKIPISRVDLAQLLGTRQESLSRAMHVLAKEGIIEILKPDCILILKTAALAKAAGEEQFPTAMMLRGLALAHRIKR